MENNEDWSIGVNNNGELYVMHDGEPVVGFTSDYTYNLYLHLHNYFNMTSNKLN